MFEIFKAAAIVILYQQWKRAYQSNEPIKKLPFNATVTLSSRKRFSIFQLIGFMVCNFTVGFTLSALINLIFSRSKKPLSAKKPLYST